MSPTKFDCIRLPNKIVTKREIIGSSLLKDSEETIQSPTTFLRESNPSSPIDSFNTNDDKESV